VPFPTPTTPLPVIVRGLFLKNPISGNPEFYSGLVADPPQAQ
jgi:hypothetical protein